MLRLAFQGLRGRKGPFVGAFVALMISAALVMACGSLLEAGLRSDPPVERYAGAPIVITGKQGATVDSGTDKEIIPLFERARLDGSLVARADAVPGVRAAVADVRTPAQLHAHGGVVAGPTGHPTAVHPWPSAQLTPYRLRSGRPPVAGGDLVVDEGLAARGRLHVGARVRLASNGPARAMTVVGIAETSAPVERQGVMFVTTAESARLAAMPRRIDAVGILLQPGADRAVVARQLRHVVGGRGTVVTGADRGGVEHLESSEAKEAVISIGGTFGGLALIIAMFVVASTISLSILQREREVALLRAVAATPRQVRRMIAWETLLVALVASACGVVPGALLAGALGRALSDHGVAPEDMVVHTGILPALVAVASSVLTATLAVASAGRRAARVKPVSALQESASEPRLIGPVRILGGLLSLAGGALVLAVSLVSTNPLAASDAAVGVSAALIASVVFLGPLLARVVALLAAPFARRRVSASLAISNLRTSSRRFSSAMTPLVLTVALTCTMVFLATTRGHIAEQQTGDRVVADLVLQSDGVGIPHAAIDEVRATPGVSTAVGTTPTTLGPSLGAKYRTLQAVSVDTRDLDRVLDLDVRDGSVSALGDDEVAISRYQSHSAHVRVGSRTTIMLGDGHRRRVRVAAIFERGLGFGDVVLPRAMTAGHHTSPLADTVLVALAPGASQDAVARRLRSLAARYPGLTVGDRDDLAARVDESRAANDWLFRILAAIVFAFTAVAVVNTMSMIAVHRTRELGLLRLIGGTPRQVRAMARWEATIVVALGIGIGGVIALITLGPTSSILGGSVIPYAPVGQLALVLGSAAAVGMLGSQLSTRMAMRPRPVDAIGLRD